MHTPIERRPAGPSRRSLRLWPGVVLVVVQWLARFGIPLLIPGFVGFQYGMLGGLAGAVGVIIWWVFFSKVPIGERWATLAFLIVFVLVATRFTHHSLGPLWLVGFAIPTLCLALVIWAALSRGWAPTPRRLGLVAILTLACGLWMLVRSEGIDGNHESDFKWRWQPTAEEQLLARSGDDTPRARPANTATAATTVRWSGFRGPRRDGVVTGTNIATDWASTPPMELWRRPVGPGWSSFAVRGNLVYTQEQRGDDEVVSCHDLRTGDLVWRHQDTARFWESNAGAGPRATPTLADNRLYSLGATGLLNALDADTGAAIWSRDVAAETDATLPDWGFSSSPLVTDDLVVVDVGGLAAYDRITGTPKWQGPRGAISYSSPQRMTFEGESHIVLFRSAGALGVSPTDGSVLWEHEWPGLAIVQPAQTAGGDLLISAGSGVGTQRLAVARSADRWTVTEGWLSTGLKSYFSDLVVHEGHIYGFDGRILAGLDAETGERAWKGGRYGNGQLLLLADQDLLLVLSEKGELALVDASPSGFEERARMPAIAGKTWNHPVLVDDVLLVRNSEEMAAFRLPLMGS